MSAFVSSSTVLSSRLSSFHATRSFSSTSAMCDRSPVAPSSSPRRSVLRAIMAEGPGGTIDFSKVNMSTVGANLEGLVFTPEPADTDGPLKTRVDVGYTPEQEAALNAHINVEYTASYAYHAIWSYFNRDTVALPGFAKFFMEQVEEEREHAHEFMEYQNQRGGIVELQPLAVPEMKFTMQDGTSDALYAMDLHLQLEKFVYRKLTDLHKVAEDANDPQMTDFVEGYLGHQLEAIKNAADLVSQIKRVGTPHGVYHIDRSLLGDEGAAGANGNGAA